MPIKTIAVLGAGHGGAAACADLTRRGFDVRLHARRAETLAPIRERGGLEVRGVHKGFVALPLLTTDVAQAVKGADLIMLVVPSVAHESYAAALAPHVDPDVPILLNPGHTGGGLHFLHALRRAGYAGPVQIGETVTLTYICRMAGPATIEIYSYTKKLGFAALPGKRTAALHAALQPLYPELVSRTSVIETGLSNINAIFHPPGMLMNAGWIEHTHGGFLFYAEGITETVGRVVSAIDAERLAIAAALEVPARPFLDVFHGAGLTTEAARASGSVSRGCRESAPNRTIKSPPTLDHRYVHEDVGYGLVAFSAFGRLAGVPTPVIDSHVTLAGAAMGIDFWKSGLTLEKMGLDGVRKDELLARVAEGL
ncbi:MAG: NAD/NADP octopine/nopaline dehydrogenase family protein [Hyphomicrobiaceae bacterium]